MLGYCSRCCKHFSLFHRPNREGEKVGFKVEVSVPSEMQEGDYLSTPPRKPMFGCIHVCTLVSPTPFTLTHGPKSSMIVASFHQPLTEQQDLEPQAQHSQSLGCGGIPRCRNITSTWRRDLSICTEAMASQPAPEHSTSWGLSEALMSSSHWPPRD